MANPEPESVESMLWSAIGVCVKFNDEPFSLLTEKKAKNKASQLGEPFKSFNGVSLSFRRTVSTGLSTGEIQVETFNRLYQLAS